MLAHSLFACHLRPCRVSPTATCHCLTLPMHSPFIHSLFSLPQLSKPSHQCHHHFSEDHIMSQEQLRRPQSDQEPIRYGDFFPVSGALADKPVPPQDAALMQSAEAAVLGQTQKGGAAATMQAVATRNERAGLVAHTDITYEAGEEGVTVTETDVPGRRIVTESVGGQVVGQYVEPRPVSQVTPMVTARQAAITIGEALEATIKTAGSKPVDQSDAAAIQAAEARATGSTVITPSGVAAAAESAASINARLTREENKVKIADVLANATARLPADKVVTRQDAEGVMSAELRNNPNVATHPGGVAASVAAAARLNESIA